MPNLSPQTLNPRPQPPNPNTPKPLSKPSAKQLHLPHACEGIPRAGDVDLQGIVGFGWDRRVAGLRV